MRLLELATVVLLAFGAHNTFFSPSPRHAVGPYELAVGALAAVALVVMRVRQARRG